MEVSDDVKNAWASATWLVPGSQLVRRVLVAWLQAAPWIARVQEMPSRDVILLPRCAPCTSHWHEQPIGGIHRLGIYEQPLILEAQPIELCAELTLQRGRLMQVIRRFVAAVIGHPISADRIERSNSFTDAAR